MVLWSDHRFCINFTHINKHTESDQYSAHRADDLFARVVKAKFLTALDLRPGYHQIPMHGDSVSKTAFWWSINTPSNACRLASKTHLPSFNVS
jgi:hypothetical protein